MTIAELKQSLDLTHPRRAGMRIPAELRQELASHIHAGRDKGMSRAALSEQTGLQLHCSPAVASRPLGCHAGLGALGDPAGPRVFTAARVAGPGLAACPGAAGLCLAGLIA